MVPFQVTLVALYILVAKIGWVDTSAPMLIAYFFSQKFIVKGIAVTGLKG